MAEIQKDDLDRFIDETLSLFQDAIAEPSIVLPPVQFGRGAEPRDAPVPELPEKRAAFLIGPAVSFAKTVAGLLPKAAQSASHSLQPPVAKQARKKAVRDAPSDPIEVLSMAAIAPIDSPNVVETASLPRLNWAEAAAASPPQPVDRPGSKQVLLRLRRLTEEEPPSLIDHAPPLVKKVVISVPKAVFVKKLVISEPEKPIGDARSDTIVDEAQSTASIAPIDEPNAVEAASLPPLDRAEAAVASLLQPVDKPASKDPLPLKRPTQEELPSLIDCAHAEVFQAVPILLKTETAVPLPQQPLMKQFSPEGRLDMDSGEIRRPVEPSKGEARQKQFKTAPD